MRTCEETIILELLWQVSSFHPWLDPGELDSAPAHTVYGPCTRLDCRVSLAGAMSDNLLYSYASRAAT